MGPFHVSRNSPGAGLASEDHADLASVATERAWEPGGRLASFLHPEARLFRIEEGLAGLRGYGEHDARWTLAFLGPGDWFDGATLTREGPHVFEVEALTATRALTIDWAGLVEVARSRPAVAVTVAASLAELAALLAERTLEAQGIDVRHRLERFLLQFVPPGDAASDAPVELAHPFTHQEMARAVGASRPHTSYVLGELEELGAVLRRGQRPVLVRPGRLRELIELDD